MRNKLRKFCLRLVPVALISILAISCKKDDNNNTVTDVAGNTYNTVTIGTQVWMASDLKTTKYNDGTAIAVVSDNTAWSNLTTGAVCDYNNTAANSATYGKLYNWYAVTDSRKLCPAGWHVPSQTEWTTMLTAIGGADVAGGKMKEVGTTHWASPNTSATNTSGFTGLGGGYRNYLGVFKDFSYNVGYWSSTATDATYAMYVGLWFMNTDVDNYGLNKKSGINVRCIRD
jgi:uncharacterized protein (TIGR02145 family)